MRNKVADFLERTAPEVESKDEAWFLAQLEAACSEVVPAGNDFRIICPNPAHPDNNPSCGVDRHTGRFHCFSCGFGGGWNALANLIGAEKLQLRGGETAGQVKDDMTRALSKAGVRFRPKKDKVRPLVSPWPKDTDWRQVKGDILVSLGCIKVVDLKHNTLRIGLPVRNIEGNLLGYTCRAVDPADAEPKYTPLAADAVSWREKELPAREALFLVDQVLEHDWNVIVLVEGPYDALRLFAHGIPAIGILGAGNWTSHKAALLTGLGIQGIVVLMDNDKAGREAKEKIIADMSPSVKTIGLRLPRGRKDPGTFSDRQCQWLKAKVDSFGSNPTGTKGTLAPRKVEVDRRCQNS